MLQSITQPTPTITPQPPTLLRIIERLKTDDRQENKQGRAEVNSKRYTHELIEKVCACGCGQSFQSANNRKKYLSTAHRQKAYRERLKTSHNANCAHCGQPMDNRKSTALFCSNSCRVMSHRVKRKALVNYFVDTGMSYGAAIDCLEMDGMKAITAQLQSIGIGYNYQDKQWAK